MRYFTPLAFAAAFFALTMTFIPVRSDESMDEKETIPMLTVTGEAALEKPADQLHISLAVVSNNPEAAKAVSENSRKMNRVIDALKRLGLTEKEYETGHFSITPRYQPRPRNSGNDWKPQIIGYTVENSLNIKTTQLSLIGDIIEDGVDAGANSVSSISFDLADRRKHRAEAIREATMNARADAEALAQAAGVKLVRVLSVNLDGARSPSPMPMEKVFMARGAADSAPPPIQPGDVTVRANVTLVYEIVDK